MKRIFIALLLVATAAVAQEKKAAPEPEYNSVREFKNKVFEIKNRDPRVVAQSVKLLGSGFKGADLNVSTELKTITVRDFPENIAAIEEAIKRLDHAAPATPDIEFKISVLIGSKSALNAASIPDDLEPVVKQLQSTLRYSHYGLMTAAVQRTKPGDGIRGSGVAEPTLLGMTPNQERPVFYDYNMSRVTTTDTGVDIERFSFSMRVPIVVKAGGEVQYQNVGFETPVSLRDKEKVVIGTTTMGDKALIVVVTATK
jgi:hypothetical protein